MLWAYVSLALLIGLALGFGVSLVLAQLRRVGAQRSAEAILAQAEREAENIRKEAELDRKSTRLNSSHIQKSRMPSSA